MNLNLPVCITLVVMMLSAGAAGDDFHPDRCEILPLPGHQISFAIDGIELVGRARLRASRMARSCKFLEHHFLRLLK